MEHQDGVRNNWWETDGWWDADSKTGDAADGIGLAGDRLGSAGAPPAAAEPRYDTVIFDGKEKPESFRRRLERLLFTYVTVFVESHSLSGVLVGVFDDFLILVKGCIITEVFLPEVEAIQYLAWGCPDTHCKKQRRPQNIVKNRLDTATILRNLFSDTRKSES